jgi:molybdopterin-containing oxidoreductase family membrane subunit
MYLTINEMLTPGYKSDVHEIELYHSLFYGAHAFTFWFIVIGSMILPLFLCFWLLKIDNRESGKIQWIALIASLLVNIGAWLKRYIITVPTLQVPTLDEKVVAYFPSTAEIWISLAQLSFFVFGYWLLNKIVPIVPLWEVEHELMRDGLVDGTTPQAEHEKSMQ